MEDLPTDNALLATSSAAKGVEMCNNIFKLERVFEGLAADEKDGKTVEARRYTDEEQYTARKERSHVLVESFFSWLDTVPVSGKVKLSGALQYCLNEKKYLSRFLEDGRIPVDNNRAENAIRPFVVGRKNWLFSTAQKEAVASAIIYSLAATATANGLNAEEYFTQLCKGIQALPWNEN